MEQTFLTNDTEETFLDRIRGDLRACRGFAFSVSFIKKAGLSLLLNDMEAALARGRRGASSRPPIRILPISPLSCRCWI